MLSPSKQLPLGLRILSKTVTALPFGGNKSDTQTKRKLFFKWRTNTFVSDDLSAFILEEINPRLLTTMVKNGKSQGVWEV